MYKFEWGINKVATGSRQNWMSYLKLQDGGQIYMIKNFGNAKNFVAAVKASCQ